MVRYDILAGPRNKPGKPISGSFSTLLITRLAACWRNGERYIMRDTDGRAITEAEGRQICAERYAIPDDIRRRRTTTTKRQKGRTGQRDQEWTTAAPTSSPSRPPTKHATTPLDKP
jgi:hypothetical protein